MDELKKGAAMAAAAMVRDRMVIGLGTGSTASLAIREIGRRVRDEGLEIRGIPTSIQSEKLAREEGIPLISFDDSDIVDLTIDGADQVDGNLDLIKGLGGALLREKVVACASEVVVIAVDPTKIVDRLGVGCPLPVEVIPFARQPVARSLERLGGKPHLRMRAEARPVVTDNGNWILDTTFEAGVGDPAQLNEILAGIPGVVGNGLFVGIADRVVIGRPGGPETRARVAG